MSSFAIRTCSKFQIDNTIEFNRGTTSTIKSGKIIPTKQSIKISNIDYKVFNCEQYKNKNNEILVDGSPHMAYQEVSKFKLYYSSKSNLLILNTAIGDADSFLKYLEKTNSELVTFNKIPLDFIKITKQNGVYMDQIWFGTKDKHAKTKAFNGVDVNQNSEAKKAIKENKATYIKVQIDINSNGAYKKRIIGFSKKSGIVIIKSNDSEINTDEKELQLLLDTFNTYKNFK